ncbi:MAG: hypothetical protein AAF688_10185 [Bacteroidota bacterium]
MMRVLIFLVTFLLNSTLSISAQNQDLVECKTFFERIISLPDFTENVISFTKDEQVLFLTRTLDWDLQSAFISIQHNNKFKELKPLLGLDSIYNGAISPDGDKIIYSIKTEGLSEIWLVKNENDKWAEPVSITQTSNVEGGYFNWRSSDEVYFQISHNNGDIAKGKLKNGILSIVDDLTELNTSATEFSPYIDKKERFIIFTRFLEGDVSQQGFFISYKSRSGIDKNWTTPTKLKMLPYGWGAYILEDSGVFLFCDGEDIKYCPIEKLALKIENN